MTGGRIGFVIVAAFLAGLTVAVLWLRDMPFSISAAVGFTACRVSPCRTA
jgi:hypothetical protein